MLNVVVVGAGPHFISQHAPALVHFVERHPGKIRLAGVCDVQAERAERARQACGFEAAFTSVEEMLAKVEVGAALAILPYKGTLSILEEFMKRGIPLVMEKPLGEDMVEAASMAAAAKRWNAPVMVSLNRRFDPGILVAKRWLADKGPMRYMVGSMLRVKRTEGFFIWGTGIHLLDAMVAVAGPLELADDRDVRRVGEYGCSATLRGSGGLVASADILPVTGRDEERLRMVGDDYCVDVWTGIAQQWSVRAYLDSKLVLAEDGPEEESRDLRNGTYNETEAFLLAVLEGRSLPSPSIPEAMVSSALAEALLRKCFPA